MRALLLGGWLLIVVNAQAQPLGPFEAHGDVGEVKRPGTVAYDPEEQVFVVAGSGANMWGDRDAFHFLWRRMTGRFMLQARGHFLGEGVDPHRKMGWIIRAGLGPDDPTWTLPFTETDWLRCSSAASAVVLLKRFASP
ncbi:hypothetical protein [Rhodothermus marinus]|uniref:hypothetical protein n=1 Tax=Rhodothermus marinus TaxID=29549 RepID=UPI000AF96A57|nr:hypothetical protein [Rhodothermus marinus]